MSYLEFIPAISLHSRRAEAVVMSKASQSSVSSAPSAVFSIREGNQTAEGAEDAEEQRDLEPATRYTNPFFFRIVLTLPSAGCY